MLTLFYVSKGLDIRCTVIAKRLRWISLYLFGLLYQVFIMSLFDYCAVIWCPNQCKPVENNGAFTF